MDVSPISATGLPSAPETAFMTARKPFTEGGFPSRHNVTLSLSKGEPRDLAAAMLFHEILKPLAQGLGPVGEIALDAVADELFVRRPR